MTRGAFVTLEGGEGVGKTSSLSAIEAFLRGEGMDVVMTREPGGTALGESVRSWILDGDHGELGGTVEALLMFAARAMHVDTLIRPALETGSWVVCDRFTDATFAYQGAGRGVERSLLETLEQSVHGDMQPDLTILLDAPVEIGLSRIAGREHDHFEREAATFFERVRNGYLARAAADPTRFRIIDAGESLETVCATITRELGDFCQRFAAAGGAPT